MNKEFKTILVLWIVSIIISWFWLYQFKDIKFKNTKNLEKANEALQENLLEQYNNIIDVYIPTITDKIPENNLVTTGNITLAIPWFLENEWFNTISNKLKEQEINLLIKKFDSYSQFEWEIKSNLQNYDIALIPSNRTQWLELEDINLWENIKPYFIDIFNNQLNNSSNTIIPFAIDPCITIYKKWISEQTSRKELFSYSLLRKNQKKYSMPIVRWFDDLSLKLIEWNATPFEYFLEILVLQLKQIKIAWDNQELSDMINTNNIPLKSKYTFQNQKSIITLLAKQNEYCETYPASCIIRYWYSDIIFWFLSNLDILNTYFPWENELSIWKFTNSEKAYPVKGRVFVVPKWNQSTNLTNQFFNIYISESIDWNKTFRNNTLSAITNIYDNQKINEEFKNIMTNENNFYIFTGSIDLQEKIINDWKTLNMLKWKYNVNTYLSNFPY